MKMKKQEARLCLNVGEKTNEYESGFVELVEKRREDVPESSKYKIIQVESSSRVIHESSWMSRSSCGRS
jgi:hypothetical protein